MSVIAGFAPFGVKIDVGNFWLPVWARTELVLPV